MDAFVFFAVLAAAACHAGWNALLKLKLEPLVTVSLISAACGIVVLPFAFLIDLPEVAAWPYLGASVLLHLAYYLALAEAFRFGDLTQVYPIARGTAPLLTALGTTFWIGERHTLGWLGVIFSLPASWRSIRRDTAASAFHGRSGVRLLTSITIAGYTRRWAGCPHWSIPCPVYCLAVPADGIVMAAFGLICRRR